MKKIDIKGLYYITHVDNVASMVKRGILSHAVVAAEGVEYTPIYDAEIVSNRRDKTTPSGASLWDYANLFFQPRNPMMYRVIHEKSKKDLAVIGVRPDVMNSDNVFLTDGNAANAPTHFFPAKEGLKQIHSQWNVIQSEWWRSDDGSKRRIMAECLVPGRVAPEFINSVYVADHSIADQVKQRRGLGKIPVIPEPPMFFQPRRKIAVGSRISLIDGDMFFSNMHTLTVSVNLQGIMGKGLASRAKYQFPDVYVTYQDACRKRRLTEKKPYLYKREKLMDEELADLTSPLQTPNSAKWFLLFATKRKWRENSRMEDIEAGMNWVRDNYKKEGIRSLALPALGCGLGGLEWADVGPVMCHVLNSLDIQSAIYLPRERAIETKLLGAEHLLGRSSA